MLDTSAMVEVLRGRYGKLLDRFDQALGTLAVSTIAVSELDYGAARGIDPAGLRNDLDALLSRLTVLTFDRADARHAGEIRQTLAAAGTPIGPLDTLIAGHARSRGLIVVTHNTDEFSRVPGLVIEDWQR